MKDWASKLLRKWSWANRMLSKSRVELIWWSSCENWDSSTSTWQTVTQITAACIFCALKDVKTQKFFPPLIVLHLSHSEADRRHPERLALWKVICLILQPPVLADSPSTACPSPIPSCHIPSTDWLGYVFQDSRSHSKLKIRARVTITTALLVRFLTPLFPSFIFTFLKNAPTKHAYW